jgi:hypothetical protein
MKRTILLIAFITALCCVSEAQTKDPQTVRPGERSKRTTPSTGAPTAATGTTNLEPILQTANRTGIVDDGFTWFEAVSTEELGQNNVPYSTGWVLKSHVRVFGDYPNRSAIKLVVSRAGKPVATTRCETDSYHKAAKDVDESYMWTNECWRKDTATKLTGNFDVLVYAVNGETDEEKLVRTYKIDVRTVNRVKSGQDLLASCFFARVAIFPILIGAAVQSVPAPTTWSFFLAFHQARRARSFRTAICVAR